MKKIRAFFFVVILLCVAVAWPVMVEAYIVEKGDILSGIAQKNGVTLASMKLANPKIKNIHLILVGQSINLPEKDVKAKGAKVSAPKKTIKNKRVDVAVETMPWNPGSNPWKLGKVEGIKRLHFSPEGEKKLVEDVKNSEPFSTAYIYSNGKVVDDFGNEYEMVKMGFGSGKFFKPIPAWKDPQHVESGWIYKSDSGEYAMFPFKCWNPTLNGLVKLAKKPEIASPSVKFVEEVFPSTPALPLPAEEQGEEKKSKVVCKSCSDQREFNSTIYGRIGSIGSSGESLGIGGFAEFLYPWQNFADDCSSEYWWSPGVLGGIDKYWGQGSSGGDSEKLALQLGVKRGWRSEEGLFREWTIKPRLGWSWSHWSNDDGYVDQNGAGTGVFGEYRHELIPDKLAAFARIDSWFGLGNQSVSSNFDNVEASSRTFGELLGGLDYKFAPSWILRSYAGFGYEGWTDYIPAIAGAEVRHKIGYGWTISTGLKGKIYAAIHPAALISLKAENFKFVPKWYKNSRQEEIKPAGRGIGGVNTDTIDVVY